MEGDFNDILYFIERKRKREIKIRMEHENRLKAIKSSRMSNLLLF